MMKKWTTRRLLMSRRKIVRIHPHPLLKMTLVK
jgi:hypothetical protein